MDEHGGIVNLFRIVEGLFHRFEVGDSPTFVARRILFIFFLVAGPNVNALVKLLEGFLPRVGKLGFLRIDEIEADWSRVSCYTLVGFRKSLKLISMRLVLIINMYVNDLEEDVL